MPELPDVEAFGRRIKKHALHQRVERTTINDKRILADISSTGLGRALKHKAFGAVKRHGKVLFLNQSRGSGALVLRFGMTGNIQHCPAGENAPDHTRAEVYFSNGSRLAVISQRILGGIGYTDDYKSYIRDQQLGPDALEAPPAREEFVTMLSESTATIKAALMNQSRLAGIGNVYADEILFQAGIKPDRKAGKLSSDKRRTLYTKMGHVLRMASDRLASGKALPDSWLLPHRKKGESCPRCDRALKSIKVSGRTT
jgi:formamidopyrimidine-DNA glycosylase